MLICCNRAPAPLTLSSPAMSRPFLQSVFLAVGVALPLTGAYSTADEPYGQFQFAESDRRHWAFRAVTRPPPPAVADGTWVSNPIDAFVLAELERAGLQPAQLADRPSLLRRLYLDLVGLPPTPDEQARFLDDLSPDAYARLVDDLLARPEYGERWARHWLDAVRYAESNGYERDGAKPNVWRYRDWVIRALNEDMPYDRFVREQLAGDELDGSDAATQIATTFLRLGPWDDEPADPVLDRYDQLDDLVGATTAVFLAQTVRCARCHDHKFEAFTQRDYARLVAVFEPLKRPQDGRTDLDILVGTAAELAAYHAAAKAREQKLAGLLGALAERQWQVCRRLHEAGLLAAAPRASAPRISPPAGSTTEAAGTQATMPAPPADALAALSVPPGERSDGQRELIKKHHVAIVAHLAARASDEERAELESLERQIGETEAARLPPLARAYCWREEGDLPVTHVFRRGDPRSPLAEVGPGVPAILTEAVPAAPTPTASTSGRRRQLADWLVAASNPLTARVMVNRIWQHHFGEGLAGTENDFGFMGEPPTHPELLDWLASEFVASGWSIKHIHRLIVHAACYRLSSAASAETLAGDPQAKLLSRFVPRRLEAEAMRDSMLAVSGALNRERGGPSVFPEIAPAVLASQSRPGNGWTKSDPLQAARRSIYVFVKRTLPLPELEVLDFPDTNDSCEQRQVSTVAPQALTLFNGAFVHEQARRFARRLSLEAADQPTRIELAYRLALARAPTAAERGAVLDFLAKQERQIAIDRATLVAESPSATDAAEQALAAFCLVLLNTNEFVYLP
jgi:hypothetical protein